MNHPAFRLISAAILLLVAAGGLYSLSLGHRPEAAAQGALVGAGAGLLLFRHRLPSLFTFLFVVAGTINTAGYVLELWNEQTAFDEVVHAFTSFTVSAAGGWLLVGNTRLAQSSRLTLILVVILVGLFVGVLWELFEWLVDMIGGPRDTLIDLIMDGIGAAFAGLVLTTVLRLRLKLQIEPKVAELRRS